MKRYRHQKRVKRLKEHFLCQRNNKEIVLHAASMMPISAAVAMRCHGASPHTRYTRAKSCLVKLFTAIAMATREEEILKKTRQGKK